MPRGFSYYRLACPKSGEILPNRLYYTDVIFYKGTKLSTASGLPNARATAKPRIAPAVMPNHEARVASGMLSTVPANVLTRLEGTGKNTSVDSAAVVSQKIV